MYTLIKIVSLTLTVNNKIKNDSLKTNLKRFCTQKKLVKIVNTFYKLFIFKLFTVNIELNRLTRKYTHGSIL